MNTTEDPPVLRQKIMRISNINAWSVTFIAGAFAVLSLLALSVAGVVVGLAVAAAGPLELSGNKLLQTHPTQARKRMVGSQLWLMLCVLSYCAWRLLSLDPENPFVVFGDAAQVFELVAIFGIPQAYLASLFIQAFYITYGLIAGLTILLQGGLAVYYRSRINRLIRTSSPAAGPQPSPTS